MKQLSTSLILVCFLLSVFGCKQEGVVLFDEDFGIKTLSDDGIGTEGPSVDKNGNLYYSDQGNDRVSLITSDGNKSVFLSPSGVTNGMAFDHQRRLLFCQSDNSDYLGQDSTAGKRRVVRIEPDSSITVLAELYNGNRLMAPNDLSIDNKGRIYFTDPYYPGPKVEKSQPTSGVYRIDGPGDVKLVISELQRPNGILISSDNAFVYVADRGTQKLHRYKVEDDGALTHDKVVYEFPADDRGVDGMAMDTNGYIFACAGIEGTSGVYVLDPEKEVLLDYRKLTVKAFNLCFGGPDGKNLYIAAGGNIYLMRTIHPGIILPTTKI